MPERLAPKLIVAGDAVAKPSPERLPVIPITASSCYRLDILQAHILKLSAHRLSVLQQSDIIIVSVIPMAALQTARAAPMPEDLP